MVRSHDNEWVWSGHVTLVGVVGSHDHNGCGQVHHMIVGTHITSGWDRLASSPGHSQILSREKFSRRDIGCEIKSGSGLGTRLRIDYNVAR